jgi:hypothetical protein
VKRRNRKLTELDIECLAPTHARATPIANPNTYIIHRPSYLFSRSPLLLKKNPGADENCAGPEFCLVCYSLLELRTIRHDMRAPRFNNTPVIAFIVNATPLAVESSCCAEMCWGLAMTKPLSHKDNKQRLSVILCNLA